MAKSFDYDVELDELRLDVVREMQDNMKALQQSLDKIQRIIDDLDQRLEDGGL